MSKYIECYWTAHSDRPPFRDQETLIPDGTIELMFNFGDDYAQIKNGASSPVAGSHVIGIRKQALVISQTKKQHFFSVRFKLGGTHPFFKTPAHLFSGAFYGIREILGSEYRELEERLYEAPGNAERVRTAEAFFLGRLGAASDEYAFVDRCSRELLGSPAMRVHDLVERFDLNYKTVERRFANVVGLAPAELLKIKRFNSAVLAMYSCRFSTFADIAQACGYYDQSHFIREFRQLTAFSPGEFLRKQFTIVQVIQPALAERMARSYNLEQRTRD